MSEKIILSKVYPWIFLNKTILKPNSKTNTKTRNISGKLGHFMLIYAYVYKNFYKGVTVLEKSNNRNLEIEGNTEAIFSRILMFIVGLVAKS